MSTLKEKLNTLTPQQKNQLMYAFEHGLSQYVSLDDGTYIGVNCSHIKHLTVEQNAGVWTAGVDKLKRV